MIIVNLFFRFKDKSFYHLTSLFCFLILFFFSLSQVGIYGWSYGGYLSAMALCRDPFCSYFTCSVAGAPVTSWDGYDTHYTGTARTVLTQQQQISSIKAKNINNMFFSFHYDTILVLLFHHLIILFFSYHNYLFFNFLFSLFHFLSFYFFVYFRALYGSTNRERTRICK